MTAIVLSWNGCESTLACLRSLELVTYQPFSVLVVDNGSGDGSAGAVAVDHPGVGLVRLPENLGFAAGMNVGIRAAFADGADAVLLLNNDMEVEPGFVEPLVAAVVGDGLCAAACAQVLFAGEPPRVWYAGARFARRRGHSGRNVGYGQPPLSPATTPYRTERACGGAMLVTNTVSERVGLFDEELFAYAEDTDWSLRAARKGLHSLVVPASVVHHAVSGSSGGESSPTSIYDSCSVTHSSSRSGGRRSAQPGHGFVVWTLWRPSRQVLLSSGRRREGLLAVRAAWRDFRRGQLGPRRA